MGFVPLRRTRLNQPNGDGIDWSYALRCVFLPATKHVNPSNGYASVLSPYSERVARGGKGLLASDANTGVYTFICEKPSGSFIALVCFTNTVTNTNGILVAAKNNWTNSTGFMFAGKNDENTLELNGSDGLTFPLLTAPG